MNIWNINTCVCMFVCVCVCVLYILLISFSTILLVNIFITYQYVLLHTYIRYEYNTIIIIKGL